MASRWAAATVGVVTLLAGCGGEEPSDLPSPLPPESAPPPASPAAALSPEDAAAAEEILAALDAYLEGLVELSKEGVPGGTEETLARIDELPISGLVTAHLMDEVLTPNYLAGRATAGELTWTAQVTEIDWGHDGSDDVYPSATLRVCLDETQWTTIDAATGQVVEGPGSRYLSTMIAEWEEPTESLPIDPGWYIVLREDSTEPC